MNERKRLLELAGLNARKILSEVKVVMLQMQFDDDDTELPEFIADLKKAGLKAKYEGPVRGKAIDVMVGVEIPNKAAKQKLVKFLDRNMGWDDEDIQDSYPELFEAVEQGKLFDHDYVDPKKIKALSKKLYDGVKPVDKLTAGYDNKNNPKAMKMVAALEKQAEKLLKGKHVEWEGDPWLVTSVEYSITGGDWWVYAKTSDPFDTENFPLIDLF
jgi:hypothetical protein